MELVFPQEYLELYKNTKPAYKKVYNIIRATILSGQSASMPKLTELAVAEALQVSRTPVRAALAQLKSEGLLDARTKKSTGCRQLSKSEKLQMLLWDEILESNAAYLAATNISSEELEVLDELEKQMHEVIPVQDEGEACFKSLRDIHLQFHLMIGKASGNRYLYTNIVEIRSLMRTMQTERKMRLELYDTTATIFHAHLLTALHQRDAESARIWMQAEIRNGREEYIQSKIVDEQ